MKQISAEVDVESNGLGKLRGVIDTCNVFAAGSTLAGSTKWVIFE